jgi:hypothetical protein
MRSPSLSIEERVYWRLPTFTWVYCLECGNWIRFEPVWMIAGHCHCVCLQCVSKRVDAVNWWRVCMKGIEGARELPGYKEPEVWRRKREEPCEGGA